MPSAPPTAPSPAGADALVGRVLAGRYRIVALLAEGGMATVFRAVQEQDPREVAIKVMDPTLARERAFAERFKREARMAGRLAHPRIVRMIDHGAEAGTFFMVMELLEGEDLFDLLKRRGRLDERAARRIAIEVTEALAEAHGQHIVHRDLKPENVFLARDPHGGASVKVLDFGIAKMFQPEGHASSDDLPLLTAMGALVGTPEYMSPEQARGQTPGPPGDVYACGVLLYAMLTGRPPFVGKKTFEVIVQHASEAPPPPSTLRPDLDPALEALILRALAKDPAERPPTAAALGEALRALGPAPPLDAAALGIVTAELRRAAEAPTLVQEPDAEDRPAGRETPVETVRIATPTPVPASAKPPAPAPQALSTPVTERRPAPAPGGHRTFTLVVAILAALLVGFALGRWTAP